MFEFGRELRRILGAARTRDLSDPGLLELLDLDSLAAQAKAFAVAAGRISTKDPHPHHLEAAAAWREHARRSGDPVSLHRAATAAQSAEECADHPARAARAALERALVEITGADLYGEAGLAERARERLKALGEIADDPGLEARVEFAWARIASREALCSGDHDRALEAAALFDAAIFKLDERAAETAEPVLERDAVLARLERADLLAGFGVQLRDRRLLEGAARDMSALVDRIDGEFSPLTWARAVELCGSTMVALGDAAGRNDLIMDGVASLMTAGDRFTREESPLDWAMYKHSLGLALQTLGEAFDNDEAFEQAETAFSDAAATADQPGLVMRATFANNRAACVARRAERRGDLQALMRAETAFKVELAGTRAEIDPVSWAVVQTNLARLYEARGELTGDFSQRASAALSFEAAFEVFCDHGLKSLAEQAQAGLERVRAPS